MFSCEYRKISNNTYFEEHRRTVASGVEPKIEDEPLEGKGKELGSIRSYSKKKKDYAEL